MTTDKRNSWRLDNGHDWPQKLKGTKFTLDILEVTGKKDGANIDPQWFFPEEYQEAVALLKKLDSGHIWKARGLPSIYGMLTGNRKRINLNSLDCIYHPG